eukprot:jgi/Galph1/1124/GphlegSOOS_G5860.1
MPGCQDLDSNFAYTSFVFVSQPLSPYHNVTKSKATCPFPCCRPSSSAYWPKQLQSVPLKVGRPLRRKQVLKFSRIVTSHITRKEIIASQETDLEKPTSKQYDFNKIEKKWQDYWETHKTFKVSREVDFSKPKYYVLDMFPYPSGAGLHVGHPEGYTATDIIARYKRMKGFQVLHPIGFDAFGLPAEQYALQTGTHPAETTERNIQRFRQQLKMLGFSYDWSREIRTTDPRYYRWTQWIFLKLWERGLAYQDEVEVNWCPVLGTVLANEEVIDGKSERGGHPVVKKPMRQWLLRITEYAERLLNDLEGLDWPENIKEMQRNWIGKSEGLEIEFPIWAEQGDDNNLSSIKIFTTRPETILGTTYIALAPEYPGLKQLVTHDEAFDEVMSYVENFAKRSKVDSQSDAKYPKTGVFTGRYAIHPLTKAKIPIWVSDYVLASYGTGAIMAVPAHDERDYEFAQGFGLPIRRVIHNSTDSNDELPYLQEGLICDWGETCGMTLDGQSSGTARKTLMEHLVRQGFAKKKVNYKLRDWLFSRQRYWGEPFPIVFVDDQVIPLPEEELPLLLPETPSIQPAKNGESPLATISNWLYIDYQGKKARRETNTMPQWAGSCWYYLRFIDPWNDNSLVDKELERYWMPVDLYVGGVEHAVLHLLYARFWHKVLYDLGVVSTPEPFQRLVNQGMILGETEYSLFRINSSGRTRTLEGASHSPIDAVASQTWVSASQVELSTHCLKSDSNVQVEEVRISAEDVLKEGDYYVWKHDASIQVAAKAHKMSKSRGNVVNPDEIIQQFGTDTLRLYLMFMGPLEQVKPWNTANVYGVFRFLQRVWRLYIDQDGVALKNKQEQKPSFDQWKTLHETIKKVTQDTEGLRFNTAISAMMQFVNNAMKWQDKPREVMEQFLCLLAPYAPHIAEEIWERLGKRHSIAYEEWPTWNEEYLTEQQMEIVIQVNGRVRHSFQVPVNISQEDLFQLAMEKQPVKKHIQGKEIRRKIYVPNKLINFVTT